MPKDKKADAASPENEAAVTPDRRQSGVPDRRSVRRGGRRATDVVKSVMKHVPKVRPPLQIDRHG
jgi:hypothetical protein